MSNPNHLSAPDPSQPDRRDQPYTPLDIITRFIAEAVAIGDLDDPSTLSHITGDLSTLPPRLREFIQKSLREQEQAGYDTPPPPPDAPQ